MNIATQVKPLCLSVPHVFQNPYVEGDRVPRGISERREAAMNVQRAKEVCLSCPLAQSCLFDAVARHDVSGVAGGTTASERQQLRRTLNIRVVEETPSLDGRLPSGALDPEYVANERRSRPDESLEKLAMRMGCSLSTIKRTLRKAQASKPVPERTTPLPSPEVVWHVAHGKKSRRAA